MRLRSMIVTADHFVFVLDDVPRELNGSLSESLAAHRGDEDSPFNRGGSLGVLVFQDRIELESDES